MSDVNAETDQDAHAGEDEDRYTNAETDQDAEGLHLLLELDMLEVDAALWLRNTKQAIQFLQRI